MKELKMGWSVLDSAFDRLSEAGKRVHEACQTSDAALARGTIVDLPAELRRIAADIESSGEAFARGLTRMGSE
jgi:hypothetical protein